MRSRIQLPKGAVGLCIITFPSIKKIMIALSLWGHTFWVGYGEPLQSQIRSGLQPKWIDSYELVFFNMWSASYSRRFSSRERWINTIGIYLLELQSDRSRLNLLSFSTHWLTFQSLVVSIRTTCFNTLKPWILPQSVSVYPIWFSQ
jgi:hypothetical protein